MEYGEGGEAANIEEGNDGGSTSIGAGVDDSPASFVLISETLLATRGLVLL